MNLIYQIHSIEFKSDIDVTSQSMKKKFRAPTPSCFVSKQVNAQPYQNNFGLSLMNHFHSGLLFSSIVTSLPLE
jgi:hypothetical protein